MPVNPSASLHFESLEELLRWLPQANENQLMTIFVWAGEQKAPSDRSLPFAQLRKETFEHLVGKTRDRLKRFLVQRLHCQDSHQAEDVVQQVLIKLFLRAGQFDPQRSFWGWLYQIARNEYIDTLRRIRPGDVGMGQVGQPVEELESWHVQRIGSSATPESSLVQREQEQQLEKAINALPRLQRSIVQWKREGLTGKEIAARLNISAAYVSQLYHEAGEVLREAVGD